MFVFLDFPPTIGYDEDMNEPDAPNILDHLGLDGVLYRSSTRRNEETDTDRPDSNTGRPDPDRYWGD